MNDLIERLRGMDTYGYQSQLACEAAARIEALEAELERRKYDGIHTCSDACQRPACVLRRENAALEAKVKEAGEALHSLLAIGPDHEMSCSIGPIYNCTCDLHPARQSARATLAKIKETPDA